MRLAIPLLAFALIALAAYMPSPDASPTKTLASEASTDWENLQVLPDSLTRDELTDIMKGFTRALGVRCDHCHINEGDSFEDFNFPSDDNRHKDVARDMMRMTWQINTEILPAIAGLGHHGPPKVTCDTCHRGSPHPGMDMDHEGMEDHHNGEDHDG
ncbi:MAG: hypothetical protein Rubg2KO_32560 [Rubricoccaceae bacterium]